MSINDRFNIQRWEAKSKKIEPQSKFVKEKLGKNFRRRKKKGSVHIFFSIFLFFFTLACFNKMNKHEQKQVVVIRSAGLSTKQQQGFLRPLFTPLVDDNGMEKKKFFLFIIIYYYYVVAL